MGATWIGRVLAGLLVGTQCALAVSAADSGYLPKVGPPPLRFAPPRSLDKPAAPGLDLTLPTPPPVPDVPPEAVAPEVSTGPGTAPGHPGAPEITLPLVGPPAPTNVPPEPEVRLAPDPPPPPPAIQMVMPQPQLFLQYFTPDYLPYTNGYGISLPVGFIPPQPRGGSSTATYQITTPEKK